MRNLFLSGSFDGKQTIYVPLSDFSGGGVGAPFVENWYLSSDGKGKIVSRWLMPYREEAHITLANFSPHKANVFITVKTAKYRWDENSLYFHTSWKEEKGLLLCNKPESSTCREWNMATLQGKGVFKGDVLSLYNHSKSWYGEGNEKIWVDDDNFPSHIGTGTEDYYNSSWAPVVVFQTPFGGAMRADSTNSRGYNTWLRTRNLDDIPFNKHFQFDFELLSWYPGTVDYASTVYWYGEIDAQAIRPEPDNN